MTFGLYTNSVSPHQLPLARELVRQLGPDNYRYIYTSPLTASRVGLGWGVEKDEWLISYKENTREAEEWLHNCDVLMSGIRDVKLFAERNRSGKKTLYCSERWFKPIQIGMGRFTLCLPGRIRMFFPQFRKMAKAIISLVRHDDNFMLYPMGVHAVSDFAWLLGAKIDHIDRVPAGRVSGRGKYLDKIRLWGYFVEPSQKKNKDSAREGILWVGRFLALKNVPTIIKAADLANQKLDLYGTGPDEPRIRRLISETRHPENIRVSGPVSLTEVRRLMQTHERYVFASNGLEGWGAVVSEALEEGMMVLGTFESGASATMLPESCLYHAGDYRKLAELLKDKTLQTSIGQWTVENAAKELVRVAQ